MQEPSNSLHLWLVPVQDVTRTAEFTLKEPVKNITSYLLLIFG